MSDKERLNMLHEAAPDLLAAARLALKDCCDLIGTDAGNALKAAIHKADGTTECDQCGRSIPVEISLCDRCYADHERGAEADSDATLGIRR